jgi:hypothetical protein
MCSGKECQLFRSEGQTKQLEMQLVVAKCQEQTATVCDVGLQTVQEM